MSAIDRKSDLIINATRFCPMTSSLRRQGIWAIVSGALPYQPGMTTIYRSATMRDVDDVVTISVSRTPTEVVDCGGNKFRVPRPLRSGTLRDCRIFMGIRRETKSLERLKSSRYKYRDRESKLGRN